MKLITLNQCLNQEENLAIQFVLLQGFLLLAIYLSFKSEWLQPDVKRTPVFGSSNLNAPAEPYFSKNIVDIIWSCQPTVLVSGKLGCL